MENLFFIKYKLARFILFCYYNYTHIDIISNICTKFIPEKV